VPATRREVDVYTLVPPAMREAPLVRCYDATYDAALGTYHVLLEDMSATHAVNRAWMPPTRSQAEQMMDVLAAFHAFWWDDRRLGVTIGRRPTEYDVRRTIGHAQCYFGSFVDQLGDRLPEKGKEAFEACFRAHAASLSNRLAQGKVTLVHGNAHASNFLLPVNGGSKRTYILDWNSPPWVWECSPGVSDVAYMMVRYWPTERRRWLEQVLLERYHMGLLAGGVTAYSWEELWDDYRQSCLLNLYVVIEESLRSEPARWYPQLMNVLSAVEDHHCLEVLKC
jgi:aminoglycoside phosphotransferase (APT) family kinase protein